ncbi:MAG TPA: DUF6502 family protein [Gammaproteobacteria bacterium]|nr:DUF6502 family protein [Gammaproteobacteria bacterium]
MSAPQIYRLLSGLLVNIMRPLVRLMLRNGITYHAFADLVKGLFVEVAEKEFRIPARKQSDSRISVITGLTRRDIKRFSHVKPPEHAEEFVRNNRAARVISGWIQDKDFHDENGQPRDLPFENRVQDNETRPELTFTDLVYRHSSDTPPRAVLDEMIRVGGAARLTSGHITLLTRAYIPLSDDIDKVAIMGSMVHNFMSTLENNFWLNDGDPLFQRMVQNRNIPAEKVLEFQLLAQRKSQKLLEELDVWLLENEASNEMAAITETRHIGLGVYSFQNKSQ